jgi:hypothetical protein
VIRCLVFLVLIACAACSPSRAIAVSATEAQERAGTIARLATHIGTVSTDPEVVAEAASIVIEAQRIEKAAGAIHKALPGVEDQTPWWGALLGWMALAAALAALAAILWQTGIGSAIRVALGWIPRPALRDAALARDVLDTSNPATIREYIASKRASDPVWEAAWKRTEESKACTTLPPSNP